MVHWVRAAHPGGEFGGQLNVKSKVTPAAQAAPAAAEAAATEQPRDILAEYRKIIC